ncbi:MAG: sulfotransferase domain-containing protein, partial [Bacteroidota bacterium]
MKARANEPEKTGFFIVGAAKAGTSALHHVLSLHPGVSMSSVKEPNFFSWDLIEQQQLYYETPQIRTEDSYEALFQGHPGRLRGEASVSYLYYPAVAKRLYDYNPSAKIIIVLREPISRAQSHYGMD